MKLQALYEGLFANRAAPQIERPRPANQGEARRIFDIIKQFYGTAAPDDLIYRFALAAAKYGYDPSQSSYSMPEELRIAKERLASWGIYPERAMSGASRDQDALDWANGVGRESRERGPLTESTSPYQQQIAELLVQMGVPQSDIPQLFVKHREGIAEDEAGNVPPKWPAESIYRLWERAMEKQRIADTQRDIQQNKAVAGLYQQGKIKPKGPPSKEAVDELNRIMGELDIMDRLKFLGRPLD